MGVRALLFDTRSIQRYVFSGNMLRTNIGASYLVDRLFLDILIKKTLKQDFFKEENTLDAKSWEGKEKINAKFENGCLCKVAYVGGGNALLLLSSEAPADCEKNIVSGFTRRVLVQCPGLQTGAAIGEMDFSSKESIKKSFDAMRAQLKNNQNRILPRVNVYNPGLTMECEINGESANYCDAKHIIKPVTEVRFYSQEVAAKVKAAADANKWLLAKLNAIFTKNGKPGLLDGFAFPTSLEELGQTEGEDYIAVVHVDGNNMGGRFSEKESLTQYKDFSNQVRRKTWKSFARLVEHIVTTIRETPKWFEGWLQLKKNREGKLLLPVRPLILGGDDITYVCAGKVALQYTERLMRYMIQPDPSAAQDEQKEKSGGGKKQKKVTDDSSIPCCGGIAIVNTSYPFFRAYTLAEQACGAAKKVSRNSDGTSWLDFVILHGEQEPTLEQIRNQEYKGAQGSMHFGPYLVSDNDKVAEKDLRNLFICIKKVHYNENKKLNLPMNKIKTMRDVLQHGSHETRKFLEQLKITFKNERQAETTVPKFPYKVEAWERYEENLWGEDKNHNWVTPYVDVIEMMDYYKPEDR